MTKQQQIDAAYHERNQLVLALSRIYPSHLAIATDAEPGWQYVVCVHIRHWYRIYVQGGMVVETDSQAAWHIPDSELNLFRHLATQDNDWDGHSTGEKYSRLARLVLPKKRWPWSK